MAVGPRDGNQVVVALASFNGATIPLVIDGVTGYLRAAISNQALAAPSVSPAQDIRDENQVESALGSFNGVAKPLLVTNVGGLLRAIVA
jgi:hypothetical protein